MTKIYVMGDGANLFFFHDERPFSLTSEEMDQVRSELQNMRPDIG